MKTIELTPKYTVTLVEEDDRHYYDVLDNGNTVRYPGVTGILDIVGGGKTYALMAWSKKTALESVREKIKARLEGAASRSIQVSQEWIDEIIAEAKTKPEAVKDEAAEIGSRVHAYLDKIVKGESLPTVEPEIRHTVDAFGEYCDTNKIHFVFGDTPVASRDHEYGGALDALIETSAGLEVLDFKTSNAIRDTYALQVAAYANATNETYGVRVAGATILRLGKELKKNKKTKLFEVDFEIKKVKDVALSFEAFLDAKRLKEKMEVDQYEPR